MCEIEIFQLRLGVRVLVGGYTSSNLEKKLFELSHFLTFVNNCILFVHRAQTF